MDLKFGLQTKRLMNDESRWHIMPSKTILLGFDIWKMKENKM